MAFIDRINSEQEYEEQLCYRLKNELKKIPHGTLSAKESHGFLYTTAKSGDKQLYLGNIGKNGNENDKNHRIVKTLTARYCIEEMISRLESNIKLMRKIKESYKTYDPNNLIDSFPKAYKQITEEIFNRTGFLDYSKLCEELPPDDFRSDDRIHRTASGIMVRSKGEVAIADNYVRRGDLFVYEKKLILPDGTELHPDFTVIIPEYNIEKYHEHLGMPENPKYVQSFLWKLGKYMESGIYPNKDLLITIEEPGGGIDIENLNQMLDWFLA